MYGCADHTRNLSICSESQQTADVAFCIVHHHVTDFFFLKGMHGQKKNMDGQSTSIVIVPDHNMQRDAAFSLVHRHVTLRVRRVSRGRRDVRTGNQSHP